MSVGQYNTVLALALVTIFSCLYVIYSQAERNRELARYIEIKDTAVIGFITCYDHTGPYRCGYLHAKE